MSAALTLLGFNDGEPAGIAAPAFLACFGLADADPDADAHALRYGSQNACDLFLEMSADGVVAATVDRPSLAEAFWDGVVAALKAGPYAAFMSDQPILYVGQPEMTQALPSDMVEDFERVVLVASGAEMARAVSE